MQACFWLHYRLQASEVKAEILFIIVEHHTKKGLQLNCADSEGNDSGWSFCFHRDRWVPGSHLSCLWTSCSLEKDLEVRRELVSSFSSPLHPCIKASHLPEPRFSHLWGENTTALCGAHVWSGDILCVRVLGTPSLKCWVKEGWVLLLCYPPSSQKATKYIYTYTHRHIYTCHIYIYTIMTYTHVIYIYTYPYTYTHKEAANKIHWIEQQSPVVRRGFENKSTLHIYFRDPRNSWTNIFWWYGRSRMSRLLAPITEKPRRGKGGPSSTPGDRERWKRKQLGRKCTPKPRATLRLVQRSS